MSRSTNGGRTSGRGVPPRDGAPGSASQGAGSQGPGGPQRGSRSELVEWVKSLGITLVLLVVIRTFLVQTFVITSGSMEDSLLVGDFLVVNRLAFGSRIPGTDIRTPGYATARLNDVVVFDPRHEDEIKLVKRIVGMPGDTVQMVDKQFFRNGERVDEPWVKWGDFTGDHEHPWMVWQRDYVAPGVDPARYAPTRDTWGPLIIPEGHYFMLGDSRDFSLDSRYWGLIESWRLEGRALFFYYSYDRDASTPFAFLREARWERIGQRIR